ncbi:MAG: glycoside hydrolase family 1 [Pedosphaera sp.]|nr:glycoside hydrolase family 1 [Pedosphaera sp.]
MNGPFPTPFFHLNQGPNGDEAVDWLLKQWANVMQLRFQHRVPIVGFTWYSITDQMDWDSALREKNNHVNPVGLYDLNRKIRPVGNAYRDLIRDWGELLPTESSCLQVPIDFPNGEAEAEAKPKSRPGKKSKVLVH